MDFSEAFSPIPNLIPEQKITRCSKTLFQNLQELPDKVIRARLEIYLNDNEMSALLNRKALIIKTLKKLIEEKGEEAVLFSQEQRKKSKNVLTIPPNPLKIQIENEMEGMS